MITTTLTITNPEKADMLRSLLLELPFVDIQYWGESNSPDLTNWLSIFARYQQIKQLGWGHVTGGNFPIWLFNGISTSTYERFNQPTLKLVFTSLAADPQFFEAQQISLDGATAYLVTLHGLEVLYELSNSSLYIAYIGVAQS
jgi:hypothetical protein